MTRLMIEVPDGLGRDLQKWGSREGIPMDQIAGDFLKRFVALRKLAEIRKQMAPYAQAAGCESDEDFFKLIS